jgi:predicted nucleic acid-binding protein
MVLDTNVVSEYTKPDCDPNVAAWVDQFPPEELLITSTTVSELVEGVMSLPEGRRKNALDDQTGAVIGAFYERVIPFDANAAVEYGRFVPDRVAAGRPIERADAQIAACCLVLGAPLATRNTKDFEEIPGLEVVNPWEYAA